MTGKWIRAIAGIVLLCCALLYLLFFYISHRRNPNYLLSAVPQQTSTTLPHLAVFVINLEKRQDRWIQWKTVDHGFKNFQRFSAIKKDDEVVLKLIHTGFAEGRGTDSNNKNNSLSKPARLTDFTRLSILNHARRSHEELYSPNTVACVLSHREVWQEFLSVSDPSITHALIFEDDIDLEPFLSEDSMSMAQFAQIQWNHLNNEAQISNSQWDIWLISYNNLFDCTPWYTPAPILQMHRNYLNPAINCFSNSAKEHFYNWFSQRNTFYSNQYVDVRSFSGAFAYIINRKAAQALTENSEIIHSQSDSMIGLQSDLGRVRIVAFAEDFDSSFRKRTFEWHSPFQSKSDIPSTLEALCDLGVEDVVFQQRMKVFMNLVLIVIAIAFISFINSTIIRYYSTKRSS
jgi:GR25 family glycosyltransferase involved in LPS biosynthesis